jgi:hypothetical protein
LINQSPVVAPDAICDTEREITGEREGDEKSTIRDRFLQKSTKGHRRLIRGHRRLIEEDTRLIEGHREKAYIRLKGGRVTSTR